MIDSHCHLDHSPLMENIIDVISRSKNNGVNKLLTISTSLSSFENILKLINHDPIIYGTFGIHPHEADKELLSKNEIVKKTLINKKIIGVGETGLDFFYNNSKKDSQLKSFKEHIEASINLNVPVIIHSRNAEDDTFNILNSYKDQNLKILMHCFTGSSSLAEKLLKFNTYFSASGIITFKNSLDLQNTFKKIPLNRLLIETDSPFLAPEPMRGKKNEPSYLIHTLNSLKNLNH